MTNSLPRPGELLRTGGLQAKKGFGQHFLLDPRILTRIVSLAEVRDDHTVIEVGPGPGGLTRAILQTPARRIIAIEKDGRFSDALKSHLDDQTNRLEILQADALSADLVELAAPPRVIIANLPYNVGTPLLIKWLESISAFDCMILMFQKEVADRITAPVGRKHYGRLAVMSQWVSQVAYEFTVSAGSFSPPPKVASAVVSFRPKTEPRRVDWASMERVVAAAFGQRRKMLRGALKSLGDPASLLSAAGIEPSLRAEDVPIDGFVALAQAFEARNTAGP